MDEKSGIGNNFGFFLCCDSFSSLSVKKIRELSSKFSITIALHSLHSCVLLSLT